MVELLYDMRGGPLASATAGVTFAIYKQQDGGAPVWMETQNVTTDAAGNYSVLLGSTTAAGLPSDLFSQQEQRWLGVLVQSEAEQPRVLLVSVPYAFHASEAERLAGHSISEFITADSLQTAVQQQLQQGNSPNTANGESAAGSSNKRSGALAATQPATNFMDSTNNQVVGVTQNGSGKAINATALKGNAIVGTTTATTGSATGVYGTSSAPNGYGIIASETAATGTSTSYGIYGSAASTLGVGIRAVASATAGTTYGLMGSSSSSSGTGIKATADATTGNTFGLQVGASSPASTVAWFQNTATSTVTGPLIVARTRMTGAQFTVDGGANVTSSGWLSGNRLISTVATGTAPLQVTSTTVVPNLNASLLGGQPAGSYATLGANIFTGNQTVNNNVTVSGQVGIGTQTPGAMLEVDGIGLDGGLFVGGYDAFPGTNGGTGVSGYGGEGDEHGGTGGTGVYGYGGGAGVQNYPGNGGAFFGGNSGPNIGSGGVGVIAVGGGGEDSGGTGVQGTGGGGTYGGTGGSFTGGASQISNGGDGIDATAGTGPQGAGYAGNFNGNLNVTGAITAGTKDFKIDHPLDPANKYLYHASVESSEMMNLYTGNVTTDSQGDAVVELPDWFEAVNTDFRYQLTVIGQFAQAIVASEISSHHFSIKTDKPNVKVSWQVAGVRQDRYAKAHPLQVEVEKPERERGYYIHPELYGAPAEKGIAWPHNPELMKQMNTPRPKPHPTTVSRNSGKKP